MAIPLFPPLGHPVQDARTGLITQPWALYFQSLTTQAAAAGGGDVTAVGTLTNGQIIIGAGGTSIQVGNLTGDVTTSGTTATTLANTGVTPGTYGDATNIPQVTVDAKGRVTNVVDIPISTSAFADYVVASNGVQPPTPVDNGAGSFVYVVYTP